MTIRDNKSNKSGDFLGRTLTPQQYKVGRQKGTEAPFSGKYVSNHDEGIYRCVGCEQELFKSDTKFDSASGWPSFTDPVNRTHINLEEDNSLNHRRVEVSCSKCGFHLGHVFPDGPAEKGGQRYCINSVCLEFSPKPRGLS